MGDELPGGCRVEAWKPPVPGVAEVFHARLVDYAYPPHCHDTWTVLIVDDADDEGCEVELLPGGQVVPDRHRELPVGMHHVDVSRPAAGGLGRS